MRIYGEDPLPELINTLSEELYFSLCEIRSAVEELWDSQVLVRDFTKHDLGHSIRVIRYLSKLLDCNMGEDLSVEEFYVLLAAAYLHDIGMQCDVPEVQQACGLLLKKGPEGYTREQQDQIRVKHGELTAAWIEHAFKPNAYETHLLRAIKTIPRNLVPVVIDVALYHTGPDIMKCPESFYNSEGEKQRRLFLALLLRFADELDIGKARININTVLQFNLPPQNALYWWLHYFTTINIDTQTNVITFKITLQRNDADSFGELIRQLVVEQFRQKNEEIVEELFRRGIHIMISHKPAEVSVNPAYYRLPEAISALLDTSLAKSLVTSPSLTPLQRLASEVDALLEAAGYTMILRREEDRSVSMVYQLGADISPKKVRVDCVEGEIVPDDVLRMNQSLDKDSCSCGYVISQVRVSPAARNLCQKQMPRIQVFSQGGFYKQLIDFEQYIHWLQQECESRGIVHFYVPLSCVKKYIEEQGHFRRDEYDSLEEYVNTWRIERGRNHISILGEFGTGKTWFCYHYAYKQLQRYMRDPVRRRFPILIPLRYCAQGGNIKKLITNLLADRYQVKWTGGYRLINELNRQGRLLFILDGFDEMARETSQKNSRKSTVLNFWKLADIVMPNSKIILTCRTEYFHDMKEALQIMGGEERDIGIINLGDIRFEVIQMREFNGDQIRQALYKRLGENASVAEKYWLRIQKDENLSDLAHRPALLKMIVDILHEIPVDEYMNPSRLYQIWTSRWLDQKATEGRTFLDKWEKLVFMTEFAWQMVGDPMHPQLRIHYQDIPKLVQDYFGEKIRNSADLVRLDLDLRAQSFLIRDNEGYYEFAHRNLAEYFTAMKYALELGFAQLAYVRDIPIAKLQQSSKVKITHNRVQVDWDALAKTFGFAPLTPEIRELLRYIIADPALLWKLLQATKDHGHERIGYTGGNAATLLKLMGCDFKNKKLPHVVMKGADLTQTDFSGAYLRGAVLREANLTKARFVSPDLSCAADLAGADLTRANLNLAIMDNVNLRGANCTEITVEEGREIRACAFNPRGTKLAYGTWKGVVRLVDPDDFKQEVGLLGRRNGHLNSVTCLAFSPDGQFLASGGYDSRIKLWDVEEETMTTEYYEPNAHFRCLAFSAGGSHIAAADKGGRIYLLRIRKNSQKIEERWRDRLDSGPVRCLAFHPTNPNLLVIGEYNGTMRKYDVSKSNPSDRVLQTISAHKGWISGLIFIPDSRYLATTGWDRNLKLWEFDTGRLEKELYTSNQPIRSLTCDPSGKQIAIGENDGRIQIIDINTGKTCPMENEGHTDMVYTLTYRPTAPDQLASVALDASVKLWNVKTGQLIREIKGKTEQFSCRGMKIGGAEMTIDERDYLISRGAVD